MITLSDLSKKVLSKQQQELLFTILFLIAFYSFLFVSQIASGVIALFLFVMVYVYLKKYHQPNELSVLLWSIIFSSILIVILKSLALSDSEIMNSRLSNIFEHINLMFALGIMSYSLSKPFIEHKTILSVFCVFFSFTISVVLEIMQYIYRDYFWLITNKVYGIYHDSMIDLWVNFISAWIICFCLVSILKKEKK